MVSKIVEKSLNQTFWNLLKDFSHQIHLARKLYHVLGGLLGIWFFYFLSISSKNFGYLLFVCSLGLFFFESLRLKLKWINQVFCYIARPILREKERTKFSGMPYYFLGTSLSLIFFSPEIATLSICYLIFADPIASLVGVRWGKLKVKDSRTFEGSLAFFMTCFFINILFYANGIFFLFGSWQNSFSAMVLSALWATLAESVSGGMVDDNFTIPVFSGLFLMLFSSLF